MDRSTSAPSATARACAWGGAAAFVASLSFTLFSYDVTFRKEITGSFSTAAVVWDAALFSLFAFHHSLFARSGLRQRIGNAFPTLERSLYVWVASILLVLVCALWRPVPGVLWRVEGAASAVVLVLQVVGIVLSVVSAAAIDIWELAGVRQIYPATPAPGAQASASTAEFKITGLYGVVRHPIYLGWFLIVWAVGTMTGTRLVFAIVSSAYVLIAIPFEERSLSATTHGAYERYRQRVRSRLIPGIY